MSPALSHRWIVLTETPSCLATSTGRRYCFSFMPPYYSCFNFSQILQLGKRSWTFLSFLRHPGLTYACFPNSGLGGRVHYEHAVPCSTRLNRTNHENGELADHSTQKDDSLQNL